MAALIVYALGSIFGEFSADAKRAYPELADLFDYFPPSPAGHLHANGIAQAPSNGDALQDLVKRFQVAAKTCGLQVEAPISHRLASSLLSKNFLIATGLAGSGKTKLAQAFGRWLSMTTECYQVVPVGADWTGNENVMGYPNGLDDQIYVSTPVLDLILRARENKEIPHFLILDEMNLSHVERYFSDVLSLIESEETLPLYDGPERNAGGKTIPRVVELPKNLFIIGTVNVDETTYMFSPKVLDRANVIEFRMDQKELGAFLVNSAKPDLSKLEVEGHRAGFSKPFVDAAANRADLNGEHLSKVKAAFDAEMLLFFQVLQPHSGEFGYRTAYEAARFIHFYKLLGNHPEDPSGDNQWFYKAFDCIVLQKLLPKLHGSRTKLEGLLWALAYGCGSDRGEMEPEDFLDECLEAAKAEDEKTYSPDSVEKALNGAKARYPLSFEKILRMYRKLIRDQFVTFAEA